MPRTRSRRLTTWALALGLVAAAIGLSPTAATATAAATTRADEVRPMAAPGHTSRITLIGSTTVDGWRYDQYRNPAYPCAVSGDNTFTIATKLGTPADEVRPLWVFLHGGGVGWFSPDGTVQPSRGQKTEESLTTQRGNLERTGLMTRIRGAEAGFRMLAVSMCNHDIYAGPDIPDPNNPNRTTDGQPRTVNGLFATKAAVQFALQTVPTDDYFLHGGSAGSYGAWHVGWALEQQGIAPAGLVADSGVLNIGWQETTFPLPGCGRPAEAATEIPKRLHPDVVDPANEPADLVADGRLSVPALDVFSVGDASQCGTQPIACPVDGATVTLGSVECMHEPMRRAIADQGPDSRSISVRLCVTPAGETDTCAVHVPTNRGELVNTEPGWPADFNAPILDWVEARRDDASTAPPALRSFAAASLTDLLGSADPRRVDADALALGAGLSKATHLARLTTSDAWLRGLVDDLYQDTLGRPGDAAGTAFWINALRTRRFTVAQVAASFYASPEYYAGIGGGTDGTWVDDLYVTILGRAADDVGRAYWTDQIPRVGRGGVALRFFQTPESARTRVTALYQGLLGRSPEASGLAFWSARVVTDGDLALAVSLAASAEYQGRAEARFP